jgi:hypothetical protein
MKTNAVGCLLLCPSVVFLYQAREGSEPVVAVAADQDLSDRAMR